MKSVFILLSCCILTLCVNASFAELTITKNAKPAAIIVVGQHCSTQDAFAARELQRYIQRISGASLAISETAGPDNNIYVGCSAAKEIIRKFAIAIPSGLTSQFDEEGYIVVSDSNSIVLAGNETEPYQGTYYAVYDFLEELGCRWYFPGEFGEVIPTLPTLKVKHFRRVVHPEFRVRNIWYSGANITSQQRDDFAAWNRRNRMTSQYFYYNATYPEARFLQFPVDDSTRKLLPKEKYWQSHPEYYSLNADGTKNDGFICMSNEDALRAATNEVLEYFKTHPDSYSFAFSPPDEPVLCHCPQCTKAVNGGFDGEGWGEASDPYFTFVFNLADNVAAVYPDRWIITLAYYNRCRPPQGVYGRHNNVLIQSAPIQECSLHSYADQNCWSRQQFVKMLRHWTQLTAGTFYYEYDPHDWTQFHRPVWRAQGIADDFRFLKNELNGWGFSTEGQMDWLSTGLNYYVRAKLAWNLSLDPEELKKDFCRKFFGPASSSMLCYYNLMETSAARSPIHTIDTFREDITSIYSQQCLNKCRRFLDNARQAAVHEPFKTRVTAFSNHFKRIDAYINARKYMAKADFSQAAQWGREMIKSVNDVNNSMLLQDNGPRSGPLSGESVVSTCERLAKWTDGTTGTLVAVLPQYASFSLDTANSGIVDQWYRSGADTSKWLKIPVSTSWQHSGVIDNNGKPYEGIAWYRFEINLKVVPPKAKILLPEFEGSDIWLWCNGAYIDHQTFVKNEPVICDLSGMLHSGVNNFAFRVKTVKSVTLPRGNGGITLPPFIFTPD